VHRIGRTGRAGRAGEALTLLGPWERNQLRAIEAATGARIQRAEVPTVAEMVEERLLKTLQGGTWGGYRELLAELAEEHDPLDLAAAALALAVGPRRELVEIPRVAEQPPRAPRRLRAPARNGRPGTRERARYRPEPRPGPRPRRARPQGAGGPRVRRPRP